MARPKDHARTVTVAVEDLLRAVTGLVEGVRGAVSSGSKVGKAAGEVKKAASAKSKKLKSSLKSYWSRLKGKARQERIRKMLAGRGLKPKGKGKMRRAK